MGAALTASEILDLVTTTQKDLGPLKWTNIATDLQEYVVLPSVLRKEKVKFDSGYAIQRSVMTDISRAAKHIGLFQKDSVNVSDVMKNISIPWRHCTTNYAFDRREIAMNRQPAKIVDLIKTRRVDAMISLADTLENAFFSKPADSNDETEPFGLPYWMVRDTTTGFNGGNPSGFTAGCAGLDSSTYTRWRNFTAQYTDVTKADLITKMREAFTKIMFKSPVPFPNLDRGDRYVIYVNYDTLAAFETLGEAQNENMGRDIAAMDGKIVFRGVPIRWIPKLDADTLDPVHFVNWGVMYPVFLRGEYMREEEPAKAPEQHSVYVVHIDMTWNLFCTNRRRLATIQK